MSTWEDWEREFPCEEVQVLPQPAYGPYSTYQGAESARDSMELMDNTSYKSVRYQAKYYIIHDS